MNRHQQNPVKRCLVFGGSSAIGQASCRLLTANGSQVSLTYHQNQARATALADEINAVHYAACDMTDYDQIRLAVINASEAMHGLDAVIQCVGISGDARFYQGDDSTSFDDFMSISQQELDQLITINSKATFAVCQAASEALRHNGGNIVILGSMDGVKPVPSPVHFATSKSALKGLIESASKAVGAMNIRINLLAPGIVDQGASRMLNQALKDKYLKHCGLKRLATAREIAQVVSWMALENTYVTGQCLLLDGGL